ncbi:hypothetical protein EYF80_035157 [Liparis tanakae]|uniref:Uncharacterized protein n=1 Tax=Liparis tanakae TaxID=230148 RepID=A0A4Z2GNB0_9TELE|nr:hypothetical protein EYF80_035157 [Liparis tanakae]
MLTAHFSLLGAPPAAPGAHRSHDPRVAPPTGERLGRGGENTGWRGGGGREGGEEERRRGGEEREQRGKWATRGLLRSRLLLLL